MKDANQSRPADADSLRARVAELEAELARLSTLDGHSLFSELPAGLALARADGGLVEVNQAYAELVGRSRAECVGLGHFGLVIADRQESCERCMSELRDSGRCGPVDQELLHAKGHRVPVRLTGRSVAGLDTLHYWLFVEDRSAELRTDWDRERRLEQVSALDEISRTILAATDVREAMDAVLDLMLDLFDCDRVSLVRSVRSGAEEVAAEFERHRPGYPGTLALGVTIPVSQALLESSAGIIAKDGVLSSHAGEMLIPDEIKRKFHVRSSLAVAVRPLFGMPWLLILSHCRSNRKWSERDRELLETIAARFVDIMTTVIADEHRRETEARYRTLVEHAPEALVVYDLAEGRMVDANQRACELFKLSRAELLQSSPDQLSPPRQPDGMPTEQASKLWLERTINEGPQVFEWMHTASDGTLVPCEIRLVRMPSETPQVRGSLIDIRERKRMEEKLRQSQKMEAVGSLAGGIAHDFNNLLVAILGNAELLCELLPEGSDLRDSVREIQLAGERAAKLTRQLLAFSRKQTHAPEVLDINACVQGVSRMIERLIGEDVKLALELSPDTLWVRADAIQIEQVILNLCTNARDAMPEGGSLQISTERRGEDRVALCVEDEGVGMAPELVTRAVEPFFTTKEVGKGTGLGLSTVYGIVKQSGGELTIKSEPGRGARVCASFPLVEDPQADAELEAAAALSHQAEPGQPNRVLFVEDDASVASVVERTLRKSGYTVFVARDGLEALELAGSGLEFDLLLTDVVMPRMGGPELARQLLEQRPGLRVLYCTGHSPESLPHEDGQEVINKPFRAAELLERMRGILRG